MKRVCLQNENPAYIDILVDIWWVVHFLLWGTNRSRTFQFVSTYYTSRTQTDAPVSPFAPVDNNIVDY